MTSPNEIIATIDARLPEALTLTVGRMADGTIEAHHLALDDTAANGLREQCHIARDRISDGQLLPTPLRRSSTRPSSS